MFFVGNILLNSLEKLISGCVMPENKDLCSKLKGLRSLVLNESPRDKKDFLVVLDKIWEIYGEK